MPGCGPRPERSRAATPLATRYLTSPRQLAGRIRHRLRAILSASIAVDSRDGRILPSRPADPLGSRAGLDSGRQLARIGGHPSVNAGLGRRCRSHAASPRVSAVRGSIRYHLHIGCVSVHAAESLLTRSASAPRCPSTAVPPPGIEPPWEHLPEQRHDQGHWVTSGVVRSSVVSHRSRVPQVQR
jgi:hypothetical protein